MNALRHGLRASSPVIRGVEDPKAWATFRAAIIQDLAPVGAVEAFLADRVALGFWRLRRCERAEAAAGEALVDESRAALAANLSGYEDAAAAAHDVLEARRDARLQGESVGPATPEVRALAAAHERLERILARVGPLLAMGDLTAAELRIRYETAASKFARDALSDLMARQGVRSAKSS